MDEWGRVDDWLYVILAVVIVIIGGVIVALVSRCPRCAKFFASKKIGEETFEAEKVRYTYRCQYCGHEWQVTKTIHDFDPD